MKTMRIILGMLVIGLAACSKETLLPREFPEAIIPKPSQFTLRSGQFVITPEFRIVTDSRDSSVVGVARHFAEKAREWKHVQVAVETIPRRGNPNNGILLSTKRSPRKLGPEGYRLEINEDGIIIRANRPAGLFYGIQSLLQLIPERNGGTGSRLRKIPCMDIMDIPRFPYRGMHLDVSRHFFPVSFVKKYIDILAIHKINTFHWHLVDDQGWRVEIRKYPRLTEVGAWRVDREDRLWNDRPPQRSGEKATYGGFYTQEEIRDIVTHAASRFVTIIPEIEMPGHVTSALAAYPGLSCTGGPYTVQPGGVWPIDALYCAGKEETFGFLEDVLSEILELFPGKYIHIGGDEADMSNWSRCPLCQDRIRKEGLKDEKELHGYFIKRIAAFLAGRGRKIIGWDEMLEGGLAPNAVVMSWRGFEGGIEAVHLGHDAIMTPTSHCYFDYYQADTESEPLAIGGYTPMRKVYDLDPVPKELPQDEAKHILGSQGNLWTEYISTPEHAEYMALPRLCALAEAVWTPVRMKNWDGFRKRLDRHIHWLKSIPVNVAPGSFRVEIASQIDGRTGKAYLALESEQSTPDIRYTLDGSTPKPVSNRFVSPILLRQSSRIRTAIFENGKRMGRISALDFSLHKALGLTAALNAPPAPQYDGKNGTVLTDGLGGSLTHSDGNWIGIEGEDMEAVLDLGAPIVVRRISAGFLQSTESWIFVPEQVVFEYSQDGAEYKTAATLRNRVSEKQSLIYQEFSRDMTVEARFIRVRARNRGVCPPDHPGAGEKAWIFCDEISIK